MPVFVSKPDLHFKNQFAKWKCITHKGYLYVDKSLFITHPILPVKYAANYSSYPSLSASVINKKRF